MSVTATKWPSHWYSNFIEHLPAAILRTTVEGKIVLCNRKTHDLFGSKAEDDLLGKLITSYYQDVKDRGILIKQLLSDDKVNDLIVGMKKHNGTPFWCSITARPIKDADGTLEFIDSIVRDITAELGPTTEKTPQNGQDKSNLNFVIQVKDDGKISDITHEGDLLYGYTREDMVNKNLADFLATQADDDLSTTLEQVRTKGKDKGTFTLKDKDGKTYHLEFYGIFSDKATSPYIDFICRDITEIVLFHKSQMERHKFLGVMEMAGAVAHQLNQPLTIVNNLLSIIKNSTRDTNQNYDNIQELSSQIDILNSTIKKIGNIRKYASMSYVGGVKIVDIDKAL